MYIHVPLCIFKTYNMFIVHKMMTVKIQLEPLYQELIDRRSLTIYNKKTLVKTTCSKTCVNCVQIMYIQNLCIYNPAMFTTSISTSIQKNQTSLLITCTINSKTVQYVCTRQLFLIPHPRKKAKTVTLALHQDHLGQ